MAIEHVVDWPKIVTELNDAGINTNTIARMLNRKFFAVKHWKVGGGEPKFSVGYRLLKIHEQYVKSASAST